MANLSHLNEDLLEGYAMETLAGADLDAVEEHLLVCASCRERLEETGAFVRAMSAAARDERARRKPAARWAALPKPVWALGLALATLLLAVAVLPRQGRVESVPVLLESTRGLAFVSAPSGKPLLLELDLSGAPPSPEYRVEIVDRNGRVLRRTMAAPQGSRLTAPPALRLSPGRYFIRLYSRTAELLREYGLETSPL